MILKWMVNFMYLIIIHFEVITKDLLNKWRKKCKKDKKSNILY